MHLWFYDLVQTSKENPQWQSSLSWKLRMLEKQIFHHHQISNMLQNSSLFLDEDTDSDVLLNYENHVHNFNLQKYLKVKTEHYNNHPCIELYYNGFCNKLKKRSLWTCDLVLWFASDIQGKPSLVAKPQLEAVNVEGRQVIEK